MHELYRFDRDVLAFGYPLSHLFEVADGAELYWVGYFVGAPEVDCVLMVLMFVVVTLLTGMFLFHGVYNSIRLKRCVFHRSKNELNLGR